VATEIRQKGTRKRVFDRFIKEAEKLPEVMPEFDEVLWSAMVESVTVKENGEMLFMLTCGTEVMDAK